MEEIGKVEMLTESFVCERCNTWIKITKPKHEEIECPECGGRLKNSANNWSGMGGSTWKRRN